MDPPSLYLFRYSQTPPIPYPPFWGEGTGSPIHTVLLEQTKAEDIVIQRLYGSIKSCWYGLMARPIQKGRERRSQADG